MQQGKGCPKCGFSRTASARRLSISDAQKEAKKHGFELIDSIYKSAVSPMKYKCLANGHMVERSHNAMQRGSRCAECFSPPRQEVTQDRFYQAIEGRELRIESFDNRGGRLTANITCGVCAHEYIANLYQLERSGCYKCALADSGEKQRSSYEERQEIANEQGLELLDKSSATSSERKLYRCQKKGHEFLISNKLIKRGNGCSQCSNFNLVNESLCRAVLETIFNHKFVKNYPEWLSFKGKQLELDGYCKEIKIAFEHQGEQHFKFIKRYHGTIEAFQALKKRDVAKLRLCKKHGITLIVIPDIVKLGTKTKKIDAILHAVRKYCPKVEIDEDKLKSIKLHEVGENRLEKLKEMLRKADLELENQEYLGMGTKHTLICLKCGHKWEARPDKIQRGQGCPPCRGVKRYRIDDAIEIGLSNGYKCLSKEYVSYDSSLNWECRNGHKFKATLARVKGEGKRTPMKCKQCLELLMKD